MKIYMCTRCGVKFNEYAVIQGISARCVECEWYLCSNCLFELHKFMENKK